MYSSTELLTLPGKPTGGIITHPIVEIRLVEGLGSGIIQVVPVALVIRAHDEVLTYLIEDIKISDEQSAG